MIIRNHILAGDDLTVDLTNRMAPGRIHALTPTQIIVHYDVCETIEQNDRAQLASGYHYHAAIDGRDRDDKRVAVRQYVPFNRRGSAAKGFNHEAINLVIVNPGPLIRDSAGRLNTVHVRRWDEDDAEEMRHIHKGTPATWRHWARYSYEERDALVAVCELLVEQYPTIHTITGHDVTDPGRKFDPGPAFYNSIAVYLMAAFPALSVRFHPPRDERE